MSVTWWLIVITRKHLSLCEDLFGFGNVQSNTLPVTEIKKNNNTTFFICPTMIYDLKNNTKEEYRTSSFSIFLLSDFEFLIDPAIFNKSLNKHLNQN